MANSLVYPERIHRGIEWTSVFETLVLCVSVCSFGQIFSFSSFNLLFLYSTVQKSVVQYRYLLANSLVYPERIQRGIEWTQFLKRVFFILYLLVGKFSHFPLSAFSFYTVQYIRVQYSTGIYLVPRYYSVV